MAKPDNLNPGHNPGHIYFNSIKKYLTLRNVLIAALLFVIYLMFSDLAKSLIFIAIFTPICAFSIQITRVIPHANFETVTPFAFFLGYQYGWVTGVFFALVVGFYVWSTRYSISQFVLLAVFLSAFAGWIGYYFAIVLSLKFTVAYFIGIIIREILFFFLGLAIGGNPFENTMHTVTSSITHLILLPPFVFIFYNLASIF